MRMREKNERSRTHAAAALTAYRAAHVEPGPEGWRVSIADPDDVAAIGDLIADLLHLADVKIAEANAEEGTEVAWDGAISASGVAERAIEHYDHERDPANAEREV